MHKQLQYCISRAHLRNTNDDHGGLLFNYGQRAVGKQINWRAYTTPTGISQIQEEGESMWILSNSMSSELNEKNYDIAASASFG